MKNILKYCAIGIALMTVDGAYAMPREPNIKAGYTCSETPTMKDENGFWICDGALISCPAGYYCPADNNGPIECPDGKTSSYGAGTTFQCYDSDASTITLDGEDTVGDDMLGASDDGVIITTVATWEPNTININWLDADGNTFESTTCEYDGSITTPTATPTKHGYTFTGWKKVAQQSMLE